MGGLKKKREKESDSGSRKKFLLPGKSGFSAIYSTGVPNVYTPRLTLLHPLSPVRGRNSSVHAWSGPYSV